MKVPSNLLNYQDYYNKLNKKVVDIINIPLIVLCGLTILFYVLFRSGLGGGNTSTSTAPYSVGANTTDTSGSSFSIFGFLIVLILIFVILIGGFKYLFKVDIVTELKNIFSSEPELDINIKTQTPTKDNQNDNKNKEKDIDKVHYPKGASSEVFHISDNKYTYDDARAVCKAFDARLASYEEVEKSYNKGGEWCSYGWSQKGLALFPTQKKTYNKLQERRGHENDCGRPGINGGFIKDKNTKFGANCFGVKPDITKLEKKLMNKYKVYPPSETQKKIDRKSNKYREELDDILITPFNKDKWTY